MPATFASDKGRFVIDGGAVLRTAPTTRAPFHQQHVRGARQTLRAARATSRHHGRERSTSSLRALSSEPVRAGPRSFRRCTMVAIALSRPSCNDGADGTTPLYYLDTSTRARSVPSWRRRVSAAGRSAAVRPARCMRCVARQRVRVRSPCGAQPRPRSQVSAAGPPRAPAAAAAAAATAAAAAAAAAAVAADAGPGRGCIDYRSCCSAVQCCAVLRVSVRYLSVSVHCVGVPGSALCLCCSGLEKEAI